MDPTHRKKRPRVPRAVPSFSEHRNSVLLRCAMQNEAARSRSAGVCPFGGLAAVCHSHGRPIRYVTLLIVFMCMRRRKVEQSKAKKAPTIQRRGLSALCDKPGALLLLLFSLHPPFSSSFSLFFFFFTLLFIFPFLFTLLLFFFLLILSHFFSDQHKTPKKRHFFVLRQVAGSDASSTSSHSAGAARAGTLRLATQDAARDHARGRDVEAPALVRARGGIPLVDLVRGGGYSSC